jgi:hypothetical protein
VTRLSVIIDITCVLVLHRLFHWRRLPRLSSRKVVVNTFGNAWRSLKKKTVDSSVEAAASLRQALDLNIVDYNLLKGGNNRLLPEERNTLCDRVANLESELDRACNSPCY